MEIRISPNGIIQNIKPIRQGDEVIIPEAVNGIKVTGLNDCLFRYKKNLFSVRIKAPIHSIPAQCFRGSGCHTVYLPKTISRIEQHAFRNSQLKNMYGDIELEYIGASAFEHCALENVYIKKVQEIEPSAFYNARFQQKPEFLESEGLEHIGRSAFMRADVPFALSFPKSLKRIERSAFAYSTVNKVWCKGNTILNTNVFSYSLISEFATKIKKIPDYTFIECRQLHEFSCDYNGLEQIGKNAFYNCTQLKKIFSVKKCKKIGDFAFTNTKCKIILDEKKVEYIGKTSSNEEIVFE